MADFWKWERKTLDRFAEEVSEENKRLRAQLAKPATWWNPDAPRPPLPEPTRPRSVSETAALRALDAVKAGAHTAKDIAELTGTAESSVRRNLYILRDRGLVLAKQTAGKPTQWSAAK